MSFIPIKSSDNHGLIGAIIISLAIIWKIDTLESRPNITIRGIKDVSVYYLLLSYTCWFHVH
uniref:Putative ovule protein n=1 Tax=Solanum chacoense TaxID=4108 RepID=A0A0V0IFY1_SOLCH